MPTLKVRAERDEARRKAMPHMCRDDHAEIRHAVSDDDERCPVCRERGRATAAESTASALAERVASLEAALKGILPSPLCGESWGEPDESGVAISTFFGAIRAARAALKETRDA